MSDDDLAAPSGASGQGASAPGTSPGSPPGPSVRPRRRRWMVWALAGSVCLNFLFVGLAAGVVLRHAGPAPSEMPAGFDRVSLWRMFHALPDETRDEARALIRAEGPQMRDLALARGEARRAIAERLMAEPFDLVALAEALEQARGAERRSRDLADTLFVEISARLDHATREEIAEALQRSRHGPRGRWGRHGHGDDDDDSGDGDGDGRGGDGL